MSVWGHIIEVLRTMYGFELIAALVLASATRLLASATRRASSEGSGRIGDAAGMATGFEGSDGGAAASVEVDTGAPNFPIPMAANLAATSARFWARTSRADG